MSDKDNEAFLAKIGQVKPAEIKQEKNAEQDKKAEDK